MKENSIKKEMMNNLKNNLTSLQEIAKERTVKTQSIEYDLETLVKKINKGIIKLDPDYQSCSFSTFSTSGTSMYFGFVATSPTVDIVVSTTKFGIDAPHIHHIALLGGTCSSPTVLAEDELPFDFNADQLTINLNASALIVGNTYFIKVDREATFIVCNKAGCTTGGSTAPALFNICIQNINVIIPADFGLETPNTTYSYLTNRGQLLDVNSNLVPDIKLYTLHANPNIYIANDKVSYVFSHVDTIPSTVDSMQRVDMTLVGASTSTKVFKTETAPGKINFFLPHIPDGIVNNSNYYRSVSNEVYPFIDMQWYSNSVGEKFYFIVRPGGDADNIVIKFDGATSVNVTASGGLKVITPLGNIEYEAAHAYQINPAGNVVPMPWQAKFIQLSANTVKFDIRSYPHGFPLFIQVDKGHNNSAAASACDWITFNGGSYDEIGQDITTDVSGNVFFTGKTASEPLPNVTGGLYTSLSTTAAFETDAFIIKFDNMGAPVWGTYYGAGANTCAYGIRLNSVGDVYITGQTAGASLPLVPTGTTGLQGLIDGFIAKFNSSGNTLLFSKYIGGNDMDYPRGIAIDNTDNVFIAGFSESSSAFPIVSRTGAYNQSGTTAVPGYPDAFIIEYDVTNSQLWGTYFGGDGPDLFSAIEIGASNSLILSGSTLSLSPATSNVANTPCGVPGTPNYFPDCNGGVGTFNNPYGGLGFDHDAMIVQFDNAGALKWSTYFGGNGNEQTSDVFKNSIAVDPTNPNIFYLVGTTTKQVNFPSFASGGAYLQSTAFSATKAYIAKFNSKQKEWITVFGSTGTWGWDAVVDNSSNVYLVGHTSGSTYATNLCAVATSQNSEFPKCFPTGAFNQPAYGGSASGDGFVAAFNSSNKLVWSTYIGGNQGDEAHASAYDNTNKRLYFTGVTGSYSGTFPTADPMTGNYQQNTLSGAGNRDTYIARLCVSSIIMISVEEISYDDNSIIIYPNPTSNNLNINFSSQEQGTVNIELYDVLGSLVLKQKESADKSANNSYTLDVNSFAKGIYMLKISIKDKLYSAKIIIQ